MIPFNKPYLAGKELDYIKEAMESGKLSGNGTFTKKCCHFFETRYGFQKCLLTTSCTDALEMAAILLNIKAGDEIIVPSYTFPATANAFVLRGAKIVFCDSRKDHPGIDEGMIESLITPRTRVIVPVHYAGVACDMDKIMSLATKYGLYVVEDSAQAIDGYYKGTDGNYRPLGSIGHLAAFSFHETKNVNSGEGGMLVINDPQFNERAEIIRENGTNRSKFFRGEIDKYGWVDIGSSFLLSDILAAFLLAQLESLDDIQVKRKKIWNQYEELLWPLTNQRLFELPFFPDYATNNAHMFYLVCNSFETRSKLIGDLKKAGIFAVFHYHSLHRAPFFSSQTNETSLPQADYYSNRLLRLPFYYSLTEGQVDLICNTISQSLP